MEKVNYQKQLDKILEQIKASNETPTLLLHSCCAPCSSYVLSYLVQYFKITVYYYNPNIYPQEEYKKRKEEQIRLINEMNKSGKYIYFTDTDYSYESFKMMAEGLENELEGGNRCTKCYELRLEETAKKAKDICFDYFCTTLSVSPYKNAQKLNDIGKRMQEKYNIKYLVSDFKKYEGYKKSIEISKIYDLYRQNYCGCEFSLNQALSFEEKSTKNKE